MTLVIISLAAFAVWEYLLDHAPVRIPPAVQPLIVVGLAAGGSLLDTRWLVPLAAAGAVALLHALVRTPTAERPLTLRRGVGRRVPDLP